MTTGEAAERATSASASEDALAIFDAERPRLVGLAYRITGSVVDAEDVVQEAWLRFQATGPATVERPAAWLTTVVSRLALDHLKAARRHREVYVGPWLPEPLVSDPGRPPARPGPEEVAELAQSLTLGFLHVLETLSPTERVVFVLADVFDVPFAEIAEVVGKSPAACRQIASRARRRIRDARPASRYRPPDGEAAETVGALLSATLAGDVDRLVELLADDAVLVSDGGANRRAARYPIRGPHRLARFLAHLGRHYVDMAFEPATVNGELGLIAYVGDERFMALSVAVDRGRVTAIHLIRSEEKLAALDHRVDLV